MNGALVDDWELLSSVLWTECDESVEDIFTEKGSDRHRASGGEIRLLLEQKESLSFTGP